MRTVEMNQRKVWLWAWKLNHLIKLNIKLCNRGKLHIQMNYGYISDWHIVSTLTLDFCQSSFLCFTLKTTTKKSEALALYTWCCGTCVPLFLYDQKRVLAFSPKCQHHPASGSTFIDTVFWGPTLQYTPNEGNCLLLFSYTVKLKVRIW